MNFNSGENRPSPECMYINAKSMYTHAILVKKDPRMARAGNRSHKHFQLDSTKIKRAQRALRTKTQTETIERALELAIAEERSNRLAHRANARFIRSGAKIRDVYGALDD